MDEKQKESHADFKFQWIYVCALLFWLALSNVISGNSQTKQAQEIILLQKKTEQLSKQVDSLRCFRDSLKPQKFENK